MRVSGASSWSVVSKLSAKTARLPSDRTSCRMGLSPNSEETVGWSSTREPAGSGGSMRRGRMDRVRLRNLTGVEPTLADDSGPQGTYCCLGGGAAATWRVQTPGVDCGGGRQEARPAGRGGHIGTSFPRTLSTPFEWIWSIPERARNGPHKLTGWTSPCSTRGRMRNLAGCSPIWRSMRGGLSQNLHCFTGGGSAH